MSFWRGVITGSILGAAMSMMSGSNRKFKGLNLGELRKSRTRSKRMLKGVTRTVNDLIK